VEQAAEKLRKRIDEDEDKLLASLAVVGQTGSERFSTDRHEVEHHLSALMIVKKFLIAVKEDGSACDVARLAEPLHARTIELRKFDVTKRIKLASNKIVVSFAPGFGRRHTGNVLGSIEEKTLYKGSEFSQT